MSRQQQFAAIDQAMLTPLVRRAIGRPALKVCDWTVTPLAGGATESVYRVAGTGSDMDMAVKWSLILKTVPLHEEIPDPAASLLREVEAYRSGWLEQLPGGLAAPRCYGIIERPEDGQICLWLEEISHVSGSTWDGDCYATVGRDFGRFNGAYLAGEPLPGFPWLRHNFLRASVAGAAATMNMLPTVQDHPLVRKAYSKRMIERYMQLWHDREDLLAAFDRLPRTICHQDAYRPNLFVRRTAGGSLQTVAIDWPFVGISAPGVDAAGMIGPSVFFDADRIAARELEMIIYGAYLSGLAEAGWHGNPQHVRLGFTLTMALRYSVALTPLIVGIALDESRHPWIERWLGFPVPEILDRVAVCSDYFSVCIDEAYAILNTAPQRATE